MAAALTAKDENVVHLQSGKADVARQFIGPRMRLWALTGSLALLLIALASTGIWTIIQGGRTYETGVGEQRTLILADGSTVVLNALTVVSVHMTKGTREVTLARGQAYFHDTAEPARPFIVHAGRSSMRAIGTEFDVEEEADRTVLTVLAGQVAVAKLAWIDSVERRELLQELAQPVNKLKAVLVSAGQQVTVLAQQIPAPSAVDVTAVTAWREQRLVFDGTPLVQVAKQFNLYSKRRLVIGDQSLRHIGVSGEYSASDPAALIGFLRSQPTLQVVESSDEFIVIRK